MVVRFLRAVSMLRSGAVVLHRVRSDVAVTSLSLGTDLTARSRVQWPLNKFAAGATRVSVRVFVASVSADIEPQVAGECEQPLHGLLSISTACSVA